MDDEAYRKKLTGPTVAKFREGSEAMSENEGGREKHTVGSGLNEGLGSLLCADSFLAVSFFSLPLAGMPKRILLRLIGVSTDGILELMFHHA